MDMHVFDYKTNEIIVIIHRLISSGHFYNVSDTKLS